MRCDFRFAPVTYRLLRVCAKTRDKELICPLLAARHKERETRQRKIDEERERRLEQSSKAYEKWRENSKNKPKPATQGLLREFVKL